MLRVLLFFLFLASLAFADAWFMQRPGEIDVSWQGYHLQTSLSVGVGVAIVFICAIIFSWSLLSFVFRLPAAMSFSSRSRRRDKGFAALSRGLIAISAGDAQTAKKAATEATQHLRNEPLALLLKAQAAQLAGETEQAEQAFKAMAHHADLRLIGLRGLHIQAHHRGEVERAHHFASLAHEIAPSLPWTTKAVLDHRAAKGDWQSALKTVESDKLLDKKTRERQRAVLETAIAIEKAASEPEEALRLGRAALKREPNFVPAVALVAGLLNKRGEFRKAAKLIEAAWRRGPHPDLARAYLEPRPAEASEDRLARARNLLRLAPQDPESRLTVAQAAIAAGDYATARQAMQPLIEGPERPTARMCLLMADLEESEHGAAGYVREWLSRSSRAPQDPLWVADGVMSEQWLPASPVTGKLDAFVWQRPVEKLTAGEEIEEAVFSPISVSPPQLRIENAARALPPARTGASRRDEPRSLKDEGSEGPSGDAPSYRKATAQPVIFPLPGAPDDPGLDRKFERRGGVKFF